METLTNLMDSALIYVEIGLDWAIQNLFTLEGVIAAIFVSFLAGLISHIRSY